MNEEEQAIQLLEGKGYNVVQPDYRLFLIRYTASKGDNYLTYTIRKGRPNRKSACYQDGEYVVLDSRKLDWKKFKEKRNN